MIRRAAPLLPRELVDVSLAIVGDAAMAGLHERFLGVAGPTDVLTFEMERGEQGHVTSGEVVLCLPEARRRARHEGVPVEHELLLYAIHGLLHLCGLDDRTPRGFRRMHRAEDEILTELGVGPVFAARRVAEARPTQPAARQANPRTSAARSSAVRGRPRGARRTTV